MSNTLSQDDNEEFLKKVRERMERCGQEPFLQLITYIFLTAATAGCSRWRLEQQMRGPPDVRDLKL